MTDELRDRWLQAEREEAVKVRADRDRLSAERDAAQLELNRVTHALDLTRAGRAEQWGRAQLLQAELEKARAQLQAVAKLTALFNDWAKPGINRAARDMAEMCAHELTEILASGTATPEPGHEDQLVCSERGPAAALRAAIEAEREACAAVCERIAVEYERSSEHDFAKGPRECAVTIRARR